MASNKIDFETGWATLQKGIDKVVSFVDSNGVNPNHNESLFTPDEYILLYSTLYCLCLQRGSNYDFELYNWYKNVFQAYINTRANEFSSRIQKLSNNGSVADASPRFWLN